MNKDIQVGKVFIDSELYNRGYSELQSLFLIVAVEGETAKVQRVQHLDKSRWTSEYTEGQVMEGFKLFDLWLESEGLV